MHFITSWAIEPGDSAKEINEAMMKGLTGFSWVRPFGALYVVRVSSPVEWTIIQTRFLRVADEYLGQVQFLMSPLMSGGHYEGALSEALLKEVNERTR